MVRWVRYVYLGLLLVYLAGLVFQVYLVGQSLFVNVRNWVTHVEWGWTVIGIPILILFSAAFSRLGRRQWLILAVLVVSSLVQPFLALARFEDQPMIAVLHPLNALLLFALTLWLIQDAWRRVRTREIDAGAGG
jgi:hypothetical protein